MKQYIAQFENYIDLEANPVAAMAKEKGLLLLEGGYQGNAYEPFSHDGIKRGYCVVKVIAGQYLTLADDYTVSQARELFDLRKTVYFNLTLAEAKERIINFTGAIKNPPNFFAYVRLYDDEPKYYAHVQMLYLEQFACQHKITYKHKFVYLGGMPDEEYYAGNRTGIDGIIGDCKGSFSLITENDFLVVSDIIAVFIIADRDVRLSP